jgi:hypothetical protein
VPSRRVATHLPCARRISTARLLAGIFNAIIAGEPSMSWPRTTNTARRRGGAADSASMVQLDDRRRSRRFCSTWTCLPAVRNTFVSRQRVMDSPVGEITWPMQRIRRPSLETQCGSIRRPSHAIAAMAPIARTSQTNSMTTACLMRDVVDAVGHGRL